MVKCKSVVLRMVVLFIAAIITWVGCSSRLLRENNGKQLINYYHFVGERVVDELREKKKLMEDSDDDNHGCNCYKAAEEEEKDPNYGNDKRLVPTGPDPLHNR